jgi:hypothetical protein
LANQFPISVVHLKTYSGKDDADSLPNANMLDDDSKRTLTIRCPNSTSKVDGLLLMSNTISTRVLPKNTTIHHQLIS